MKLLILSLSVVLSSLTANAASYRNGPYNCGGNIVEVRQGFIYVNGIRKNRNVESAVGFHLYCAGDGSGCSFWQLSYKQADCQIMDNEGYN